VLAAAIVISLLVLASLTADRDHGSGPLRSEAFGAGQEAPLRPLISASGAAAPRTSRRRPAPRSHPAYRLLHGVDVSHWNHSIRWKRVRASGQTFAIMKATEGRKQVDRTYARNRRRAMRAGMIVAAYHFAIPDRRPRDAIIEANHFLRVAHVRAGDIVPVLDLETNEGLSHRALIAWTRQWLQDVYRRTGQKAIIYTGALRWKTEMRNTEKFARMGYPLWVANWSRQAPWIPAHNWAGHGWTFWQHGACGHVPGIKKCVDLDRYRGRELAPVQLGTTPRVPPKPRHVKKRAGCGSVRARKARGSGSARSRSVLRRLHGVRGTGRFCGGPGRTARPRPRRGPRT